MAGAGLSAAQRRALADAYGEYERSTNLVMDEWVGAASRLSAELAVGGEGGGSSEGSLASLERTVAAGHLARHVLAVTLLRVVTPRQLASMAVDMHPHAPRLLLLAAMVAAQERTGGSGSGGGGGGGA